MKNLEKYFDNKTKISSYKLKLLIIQEEVKAHQCEHCLESQWLGSKIPLELHHIDGNSFNNNLTNLQLLCPNCHSLTDNYRAKKQERKVIKKSLNEIINAIELSYNARQALIMLGYAPKGANYSRINNIRLLHKVSFKEPAKQEVTKEEIEFKKISKSSRSKQEAWFSSRKVDRPSKEELLKMVWEKSITQIAKSIGVCDNSIRKWAKQYKIPVPPVGYWAKFLNGHYEECLKIKENLFTKFPSLLEK